MIKFSKFVHLPTLALVVSFGFAVVSRAQNGPDPTWSYSVQLAADVQASPAQITLHWDPDQFGADSYTIYRKTKTATSWGNAIATLPGSAQSYADSGVTVGTGYEYQVVKVGSEGVAGASITSYGYIYSGIEVPLIDARGKLVLLVATNATSGLETELGQLQQDLVGDGWQVIRHDISSNDTPASARALIVADYNADPSRVSAVFLFGHVPVLQSGMMNYDSHGDRPMPADGFYGDVNGNWSSSPSFFPSDIELEVGRVDLADMPATAAPGTWPDETELLRNYLHKDHLWRTKQISVPRRALLADRFGLLPGNDVRASSGFRNFAPFVGLGNTQLADVSDAAAPAQRWVSLLTSGNYLWAYGNGGGQDSSISELGLHGEFNDVWSTDLYSQDAKAVFFMIEGSHMGNWDHPDDILRAVVGMRTMGLAVCCIAGHPQWYCHHMGLGETIGYSTRVTMNNSTLYHDTTNIFNRAVYIELMGDPTLRMDPIAPPSQMGVSGANNSVTLTWAPSSDSVIGYHVYRAPSLNAAFTRLTDSPIGDTSYQDSSVPAGQSIYMVRAIALESNPSGSYLDPSQGAFIKIDNAGGTIAGGDTNTIPTTNGPPQTGAYNGLFFQPGQVDEASSGAFTISVTAKHAYSGRLQLAGHRYALKGKFGSDGLATNHVSGGKNGVQLEVQLRFGSDDQAGQIFGSVSDGTWIATLMGNHSSFNARKNPAPQAGSYTMIFPGSDGDPTLPTGDGYATVKISTSGQIVMLGALADGTKIAQRIPLSNQGTWPLYLSLYGNQGSVIGWVTFAANPDNDLTGLLTWIKPASARSKLYPAGFTVAPFATGSAYSKVKSAAQLLSSPNVTLTFTGGTLTADLVNSLTLGSGSHITDTSANQLHLNFTLATGKFSGTVADPAGGRPLPFSGVVLQKSNSGSGFLVDVAQSSRVILSEQ
jgi:hypothetical protein